MFKMKIYFYFSLLKKKKKTAKNTPIIKAAAAAQLRVDGSASSSGLSEDILVFALTVKG